MPFELQDDFGDDDALLNVDVDAMAAARRAAPPAGPGPRYGSAPPHAAPPPHARHPAQRMPYPHELPSAHQRGGPAAPRSTHAHAPGVAPDHRDLSNRPVPLHPPETRRNLSGFSGHAGRNGGFSGAGGAWHESRRAPDPPRWRSGHDAVDRATASGAVRGAAAADRDRDPNQRTVNQMFAAKQPQQPGPKQRTLEDAFGGDKKNARAASASVVARSMSSAREAPPAHLHAHLQPIELEDDWNVDRWAGAEPEAGAPASTPMGPPAARGPASARRAEREPARTPAPLAPSAMGTPDTSGLVRCLDASQGMRLDPHTAQTYVYPGQLVRREYQFDMTRAALFTNSLVCLPTGLGKTLIAAVVMKNFHRWFPRGKVVFLAPTRPLVEQQKAACRDICGMPSEETCTLMGSTKRDLDGTRRTLWQNKRLFFCTPQTMENDLRDGVCPAHDVVCLVIDEAHRAKGNHAYCGVVKQLWERNVQFRLLALTATPGHDVQEVQSVVRALAIGRIDFRSDQDEDVRKHTHKREVKLETVASTKANEQVLDLLRDCLRPMVKKLLGIGAFADGGVYVRGFAEGTTSNVVKPYTLLKAQNEMRGNPQCVNQSLAFTIFQKAHFIAKIAELLTTHTPRVAVDYVGKEDTKSYVGVLFREFPVMREALDMLRSMAGKGAHHSPKMGRLASILRKHFAKNGEFSRVMIFTSFRDSVHDIVRACREMSDTETEGADAWDGPESDAGAKGRGKGTIAGLFAGANAGKDVNEINDAKDANEPPEGSFGLKKAPPRHRVKVAAFIGQGDTSKGGAGGAGAARGTKGQSQKEQKSVLDAFRSGSLNTVVATSIGEEGLDIPAVDLIVFFDVVDIIRTIQRMGRTGRARDGNVVVLATEGKEAQKFKTEYDKYNYMLKSLSDPARVFDLCNDCPRMLPRNHEPRVEFAALGPSPEEVKRRDAREKARRSAEKIAVRRGGKDVTEGGKEGAQRSKDPFAFSVRAWDAPLTIVETSLLAAYAHPPGAVNEIDVDRSAPFQRRATPVFNVPHGRMAVALMKAVSAAQGLPPPRDVAGKAVPGGAVARARDAEEEARRKREAAFDEANPPEAHFAPPVEWDGDRWEPPARDADAEPPWSDDDEVWEPRYDESCEYAAPPCEDDLAPAEEDARVAPTAADLEPAERGAEPAEPAEPAEEEAPAARETPRAPTGATQRLDFSTQPCSTQGTPFGSSPARAPLETAMPPSQLTAPPPAARASPTAAESARRRLASRQSQSQSQSQSQPQSQSRRLKENDPRGVAGAGDDDDDDDETLGDIAFHIEQRRLAALAKRRSASAAAEAEKRESVERDARLRASMPPPPPRAFASPAATASPAVTPGSGGGWGGATPAREGDTSGWGADSSGFDSGGKRRDETDAFAFGDAADDADPGAGWGAATQPSPISQDGGERGWGAASPVDLGTDPVGASGGWGAPSQPFRASQDRGGGWGAPSRDDAAEDDWGAWGGARAAPAPSPAPAPGAAPSRVAPTPDSDDLRVVKRRKRRADDARNEDEDEDEDDEQPSLNPRRRRDDDDDEKVVADEKSSPAAARAPSRRAARAVSRREARADAAKAAVSRFLDDEASGGDDDEDDAEDGWCTDDEAFIAPTRDAEDDAEHRDAYRLLANERAVDDDGDLDDSGGRRRVLACFGPRTARCVRDTPSPSLPPGQTPVASQYGGSFIDDDEYEAGDGGW